MTVSRHQLHRNKCNAGTKVQFHPRSHSVGINHEVLSCPVLALGCCASQILLDTQGLLALLTVQRIWRGLICCWCSIDLCFNAQVMLARMWTSFWIYCMAVRCLRIQKLFCHYSTAVSKIAVCTPLANNSGKAAWIKAAASLMFMGERFKLWRVIHGAELLVTNIDSGIVRCLLRRLHVPQTFKGWWYTLAPRPIAQSLSIKIVFAIFGECVVWSFVLLN